MASTPSTSGTIVGYEVAQESMSSSSILGAEGNVRHTAATRKIGVMGGLVSGHNTVPRGRFWADDAG